MTIPLWLDALVAPRTVALVGASHDPTRVSGRALAFFKRYGYTGELYPINHRADTVQGLPAYRRLEDLPTVPDLALISTPADRSQSALETCAAMGVTTAIVYASGFAEQDVDGQQRQQKLRRAIAGSTMRVLGPNCLGAVSCATGVTATFATAFDEGDMSPGSVALLTQSGAFASFVYGVGRSAGIGFGFLATTGNEMDLTLSEVLAGVVELPQIDAVLMHIESIRDHEVFVRAAYRARELGKPIAAIKVGSSPVGALAARAHTGAEVGVDAEYDDLFSKHGIHRVHTMADLADAGQVFQSPARPAGRRATIVSVSGGTGVLMADVAELEGLEVPGLPTDVRERLDRLLPPFASTRNPVDVTGAVFDDLSAFETVLRECLEDPSTDMLLVAVGNAAATEHLIIKALVSAAADAEKPVYVAWVGGSGDPARQLVDNGIPTFDDPTRVVRAAAMAASAGRRD